jgi:hypothetical protein
MMFPSDYRDDLRRLRMGVAPRPPATPLWPRRLLTHKAGFNPNQPRVPAGNPDGGQWTNGDSGSVARVRPVGVSEFPEALPESAVMNDANPGFTRVADRFPQNRSRVEIDYSRALTGISTIDETTKALSETLARTMETMDFIPEWTPQQYGTAVHVAFGTAVRLQGLPGIGFNDVEHSFKGGEPAAYGELGSIRTDVVLRNAGGDVIAIYDVKTGGAQLSDARVRELREKTRVGPNVPIIELHVLRGARLKGRNVPKRSVGVVMARLWNPEYRSSLGLPAIP